MEDRKKVIKMIKFLKKQNSNPYENDVYSEKVSRNNIIYYSIFFNKNSENIIFNSINREIIFILAKKSKIKVSKSEIEEESFRIKRLLNITTDEEFRKWLEKNDLKKEDFLNIVEKILYCRKFQEKILKNNKINFNSIIHEELILTNNYSKFKNKTKEFENYIKEEEQHINNLFNNNSPEEILNQIYDLNIFNWKYNFYLNYKYFSKSIFKLFLCKLKTYYKKLSEELLNLF